MKDHQRRPRPASPEAGYLDELDAIYRDVDARYAGSSCPASTECCRFGVTGREPYVTSIELLAIRRAVAARGGVRARRRSEWPTEARSSGARRRVALPVATDERRCPLLSSEGRCSIYAARPLGCRTFYCDRATLGSRIRHADVTSFVRRVQDVAARHEPEGDRGRPLTRAL